MVLTSIQAGILLELHAAQTPLVAETIAKRAGLTVGVVRHNIIGLNRWLRTHRAKIVSRPKFGYKLEADESCRKRLLDELSKADIQTVFSPLERNQWLLFDLLSNSTYQSLEQLARRVGVSKSTLLRELDNVQNWLNQRNLVLERRPKRGTAVVGNEITIRHSLISLITEIIPEVTLMRLIHWGIEENLSSESFFHPLRREILLRLRSWDLKSAARLISRVDKVLALGLPDGRFLYLTLYWAIAMLRARQGQIVSLPVECSELTLNENELQVLRKEILDNYGREVGLTVPYEEALMFILKAYSSPRSPETSSGEPERAILAGDGAPSMAKKLIEEVTRRTGCPISNVELVERLTDHLAKMLVRIKYNLPIENPFANDVIHSYPEIWQATADAVRTLGPQFGALSHEEIAFLAMYFILADQMQRSEKERRTPRVIVVCPTGGVSVWMLVSRLKTEVPEIEVVANVSLRELNRIDRTNIDAIITTARNITNTQIPVICVSPFLSDEETERVRTHFRMRGYSV